MARSVQCRFCFRPVFVDLSPKSKRWDKLPVRTYVQRGDFMKSEPAYVLHRCAGTTITTRKG